MVSNPCPGPLLVFGHHQWQNRYLGKHIIKLGPRGISIFVQAGIYNMGCVGTEIQPEKLLRPGSSLDHQQLNSKDGSKRNLYGYRLASNKVSCDEIQPEKLLSPDHVQTNYLAVANGSGRVNRCSPLFGSQPISTPVVCQPNSTLLTHITLQMGGSTQLNIAQAQVPQNFAPTIGCIRVCPEQT